MWFISKPNVKLECGTPYRRIGPSKTETVQSMSSWQSGLICKGLKQTANSESMVPVPVVKMTVFFEYKNRLPVV